MKKKKSYQPKHPKDPGAKEPDIGYGKQPDKTICIFSSFEEENEYVTKKRAALSCDDRMIQAEQLRKFVFHNYLLPDGSWLPVAKVFKIMKPYTNEREDSIGLLT